MKQLKSMNGESGALIIEATWCIIMSIIVLCMILSLGFYMFQVTSLKILANDIAQEVAQTYKLEDNVKDATQVDKKDVTSVPNYRYVNSKSLKLSNLTKALDMAKEQGGLTALNGLGGGTKVTIKTESDDIGRRHHEVTVTQDYDVLLGGMLSLMGVDSAEALSVTAYAQGVDMLNYSNSVKTTKYAIDEVIDTVRFFSMIDSVVSLVGGLAKMGDTLLG